MSASVIQVKNLSHKYATDWAIKDLEFELQHDGVIGLLGANGAGKSTFMNIVCGALFQTEGDVWIDGLNIRDEPLEAKKKIGFLPQQAPLHMELTVHEYLTYCARLRNLPSESIKEAVEAVMNKCGISHFANRLIGNLSGGYKQRVGIAQSIIHDPTVVIMDEPTNGLDPNQIATVRELIKEIAQERFVIFSSHILSEVQAICSNIIMIDQGIVVFKGSMNEFNQYTECDAIKVSLENPPATSDILKVEGVTKVEQMNEKVFRLIFEGDQSVAENIVAASVNGGWKLRTIEFEQSSLEETFARLSVKRQQEAD